MKAIKKINNNVAYCVDGNGRELIALGKGIGFGSFPRDLSLTEIERTFYNIDSRVSSAIADIDELIKEIQSLKKLKLRGFMGIGKDTDNRDEITEEFAQLKNLFDKYKTSIDDFDILSIGMTHDLDLAIAQGSTEVRIGTAIFGAREYKNKTMNDIKIAFIGGGNMSSCIYDSIIKNYDAKNVTVSGPHLEKLEKFKAHGSLITTDNVKTVEDAQVIFLGVKPQILTSVLEEIKNSKISLDGKLFISMAAGYKLSSIYAKLETHNLIRIMPNIKKLCKTIDKIKH